MRRAWLSVPLGLAALCVVAAAFDASWWAAWFEHPWRGRDAAAAGAALWRAALLPCAAALAGIPIALAARTPPPRRASPDAPPARPGRREWAALAALCALALAVRAARLGESLWYDEIAAWTSYGAHGPGAVMGNLVEPSNHVAHTLLTWCSVALLEPVLGFDAALRVPALLFSLAAVPATWAFARRALPPGAALAAAGLAAVLPVMVLEGTEARGYSMMICAAALSSAALLANLRDERAWRWCAYAGVCALGAWAHPLTVFVPIGHAAWLGWRAVAGRDAGPPLRGGLALLLAAVVTLTLYAPVLPDLLAQRDRYVASRGDEPALLGPEGWHALLQLGGSWYAWAAAPGLALLAVGLVSARRRAPLRGAAAAGLLGLPVFTGVVLAAGSWMYARFALFSLPGAIVMTAAGIEALWRRRPAAGAAAAAVLLAASAADLVTRPARQPLREAARFVRDRHVPGDSILVVGLAHRVLDRYLGDLEPAYSLGHGADLAGWLDGDRPRWIVVYYPRHLPSQRRRRLEAAGYEPLRRYRGWIDWGGGDVVVYGR